jgi:hypothetical protein
MDNQFVLAAVVAFIYIVAKVVEMRFIDKESKPLSLLVRDALVVYVSAVSGLFLFDQFKPSASSVTQVFTDAPGF